MPPSVPRPGATRLDSGSGMSAELCANASLRRLACADIALNLFVGNELEGGPANLYLRDRRQPEAQSEAQSETWIPLLGPRSRTLLELNPTTNRVVGMGRWRSVRYFLGFVLAESSPAWFWHVGLENAGDEPLELDLIYAQDVALAPYGMVRTNEYYVSHYVDHTPLSHALRGHVIASRQNLAQSGRNPWCVIGSLRTATSFATDAMQLHGLATRAGRSPPGVTEGLPGARLQHEHSMVALQDAPLHLDPHTSVSAGFFGCYVAHHPDASSVKDLDYVDRALALAEASPIEVQPAADKPPSTATLFSGGQLLDTRELDKQELHDLFGADWRHEERDRDGDLLSFFPARDSHVVLRAKELRTQRPHGHLLRSGLHATPDETALTSTVWMAGVFNSMVTQGHVSINRFLSTVRSYLGLFRSHGQRVFARIDGAWRLLDVPSAFEMEPSSCRWIYRHRSGRIEVRTRAHENPRELSLELSSTTPIQFLICHHVALNGDDGSVPGAVHWRPKGERLLLSPAPGSELANRFPSGAFLVEPGPATTFERVGGDELLFIDGESRDQPYICVVTRAAESARLLIRGELVQDDVRPLQFESTAATSPQLQLEAPPTSELAEAVERIAHIVPWYAHNALVHYLSPRGLEQYSGGGWGTRDICQGPVELLLALDRTDCIRDVLLRVMSAQDPTGDWPQWFMFFERERHIRAPDSHGDIVFWPVLALAQYLLASGDAAVLDQPVSFFDPRATHYAEHATVWEHAQRALALIERRVVKGTSLAAYGHGDWNDALQPADPRMREHMCSTWTVTLHHQTLTTLAKALRAIGRNDEAAGYETRAASVRKDFQRLLLVDGVLTGYALFENDRDIRYLLHPRDQTSGVRYSALAMVHAILEDMLSPAQARDHLKLIRQHLTGPDGLRLFDRPMPYNGGLQRFFQRAESATFFGREIGLMYMHAHLRYAQALAHIGDAEGFFHALCQAIPIGIRSIVPPATLRQANCYYSSSDAAFADRYQASAEYERVRLGTIALDGGWRIYSSGAGIALGLIVRRLLGFAREGQSLVIDPVIPAALDGLRLRTRVLDRSVEVIYRVAGSGCGVSRLTVNGQPIPLTHDANPHRRGAARTGAAALQQRLNREHNSLEVRLGR